MSSAENSAPQNINTILVVLLVVAVGALGALAYVSGFIPGVKTAEAPAESSVEPGNPVVGIVNGEEITRQDVLAFVQNLPEQARQLPLEQLFGLAFEQLLNTRVMETQSAKAGLDNDPEVLELLDAARTQIVRNIFVQREVTKTLTPARLKEAYATYVETFPELEEVKARHILVEDEELAKKLIKDLADGGDFGALAGEHSTDDTAQNGGELNYFAQNEVVKPFADAAFSMEPGTTSEAPVQTQFGYHVIRVEDKRVRPAADFETAKPYLEVQLRRQILDELVSSWREMAQIERFDINGNPLPEAPAQQAAPAEAAPAEAPVEEAK